jgi:hypothetical protein
MPPIDLRYLNGGADFEIFQIENGFDVCRRSTRPEACKVMEVLEECLYCAGLGVQLDERKALLKLYLSPADKELDRGLLAETIAGQLGALGYKVTVHPFAEDSND